MDLRQYSIKKFLVAVIGVLVVLFFLIWLWGYLNSGRVSVTASDPEAPVTIEYLDSANKKNEDKIIKFSKGSLSIRVKKGFYKISAGQIDTATSKIIEVKARSSEKYVLNLKAPPATEPVLSVDTETYSVAANKVRYLNDRGQIVTVDSKGRSTINKKASFKKIIWNREGIGFGQDQSGKLILVENGSLKTLKSPEKISDKSSVYLALSDSGDIYTSVGSNIYKLSAAGQLKKIYTTTISAPLLFASTNKLLITSPLDPEPLEGDSSSPQTEIISVDGRQLIKKGLPVAYASWSPDENTILIKDLSGESRLFDNQLNPGKPLPSNGIVSAQWKDNSTLYYITSSQLFSFNVKNQIALTLDYWDSDYSSLSSLLVDTAGENLYFIRQSDGKYTVQRTVLAGKQVLKNMDLLQVFLPKRIGGCFVSYVNILKPTIIIKYSTSSGLGGPDSCLSAAIREVNHIGIDYSEFSFKSSRIKFGD